MESVVEEVCASCGNSRLPDGNFCLFCGDVLTEPASPVVNGKPSTRVLNTPDKIEYAGFWLRFLAGAVDVGVELLGALLITLALDFVLRQFGHTFGIDRWDAKVFAGFAYIPILAIGSWLYCAFTESSAAQATLGKRLLGLRVMNIDGGRVSFGQATVRHFMKFLSFFCAMIGFMMAGWTKRRQALHDIPTDVLVIRVPPKTFSLPRS
jgi:uncharacterized RDD family membrane protein YckC